MAARALGEIGPAAKQSIPLIITALRNDTSLLRVEYASALGKFGTDAQQAVPDLLPLTKDPDPNVRNAASEALLHITPKP
jgi:HEAT repeat protein